MTPATADPTTSETPLVERLRQRDPDAFEDLVRLHGRRLHFLARSVLRNDDDAHDAVQQALISAYRALPRFEAQSRLSTWLYRIVMNAALTFRRGRERRKEVGLDDVYEMCAEGAEPALQAAEARIMRRQLSPAVASALARLPVHHRRVLELDLAGLDTEAAAEVLGLKATSVKLRRFRARRAMRRVLPPTLQAVVSASAARASSSSMSSLPEMSPVP